MVEESLITDKMRSKIGVESKPEVYEVTKEMIQRFIQATGDSNPLWQDKEYAKKSKYGGIIAPPTIIPIIGWEQFLTSQVKSILPEGMLHSSTELECYQPVRPGDRVSATNKVTNMRERQSKTIGRMLLVTFEGTYKNQSGELLAKCQQTLIGYETGETKNG
jgi:acyl dehydratase